jgi:MOSC domain-containing protein YiiM
MTERRMGSSGPHVHQINVSNGGVPKLPVPEARITTLGVDGDRHNNQLLHGGPERAVCLFSLEVIEALRAEGHPISPGSAGENLTIAGLDWSRLKPGDRLVVGAARLEVMSYTAPCDKNARWFLGGDFTRISQKRRPGWSRVYAKVLAGGIVRPGDPVKVEEA